MYRISRPWLTLVLLLLTLSLLAGCTRDRAAETPETGDVQTQNGVADSGDANTSAEPEVTVIPVTDTPVPTPTPTPEPETITYRVLPGDTVSTVAEKFGTTSENIRQINLLGTDALQVGQVLRVPFIPGVTTAEGIPSPTPAPLEYTVQEGDTLLSIAIDFGVTTNSIIAANTIRDPDNLVVGQVLTVPGATGSDLEVATTGGSRTTQELIQHTVAQGETLSTIAESYGVSTQAVSEANSITDPNTVRVGQILTIPVSREIPQIEHTVAAGETLFSIAIRYDVDPDVIVETNSLADPDAVSVGQVLIVPGVSAESGTAGSGAESGSAESAAPVVHTVAAGETLSAIAVRYGVSTQAIIDANAIGNPNVLRPGEELTIPGITQSQAQSANQVTHTVAAGETLFSIARRYGVSVDEMVTANQLANPNQISVGQVLTIP